MEQKNHSSFSVNLPILLGALSIVIMVVLSIVAGFGALYYGVFFGIMNIIMLGLPIAGAILAYIGNKNLASFELLFNLAILATVIIAF